MPEFNPFPQLACDDAQRRGLILTHPFLNGIDYIEYDRRPGASVTHVVVVHFLKPLPDSPHSDPDGAYGLTTRTDRVHVFGGSRIVGIEVLAVALVGERLEIEVSAQGDFSEYTLALGWQAGADGTYSHVITELDPRFSVAPVYFRAGCPVDFDCLGDTVCPTEAPTEPRLDYLAKDYASFRQLLLDFAAQRNRNWSVDLVPDMGVMLLELLAYVGDHLSYAQDAVANERHLETARQRLSARRHARLIDYRMHNGRNAWTAVFIEVDSVSGGRLIDTHTKLLTRITAPMEGETSPPGVVIDDPDDALDSDPALARAQIFETAFPLEVSPLNNLIYIHSGGDLDCCLPSGTTSVDLYAVSSLGNGEFQAELPALQEGDYLLIEEVKDPQTGLAADADPFHRYLVRLSKTEFTEDKLFSNKLNVDNFGEPRLQDWLEGDDPLPILRVTWDAEYAPAQPVCLSFTPPAQDTHVNVSVARGNIVLADHGRTVAETLELDNPLEGLGAQERFFQWKLSQGPLTWQCMSDSITFEMDPATGMLLLSSPRMRLDCDISTARPSVAVEVTFPTGSVLFTEVPELLDSTSTDAHFVAEMANDGAALLRFGNDEYGRHPVGATKFAATYRIGNGTDGNIGAEAISHIVQPTDLSHWPGVLSVRNPLAAQGGADPETIEQVRQRAPAAFRATTYRAVTPSDYTEAALGIEGVAGAVTAFRWSGSWYSVLVAIDPVDESDLRRESGGRTYLVTDFAKRVRAELLRYKLAGYALRVRAAEYVPLDIELSLCVGYDYFRQDVLEVVQNVLSNRINADGTKGFFHSDHLTFNESIRLSAIYAAIEAVEGVESALITRFQRFGCPSASELESGVLPIGEWEIAQLENDANFMERGVLRIDAQGGK